jgi:hypothetical protein
VPGSDARRVEMKLGVCLAVLTCVALLASTTGVAASEDTPPSAATLAKAYLAALGPAGAQITRAEAELRALPATATPRQVNKIVATVASKLEAIERLLSPTPAITLESLGKPTISPPCGLYSTPAMGAHLVVANSLYSSGLQLTAPNTCTRAVSYEWRLTRRHTSFSATIALDATDQFPSQGPIMYFLGNSGAKIPFKYKGKFVYQLQLTTNAAVRVTMDIIGESRFTIQLDPIGGGTNVVDIINNPVRNAHHAIVWLNPKAKRTLSPMPLTWRRLGPH